MAPAARPGDALRVAHELAIDAVTVEAWTALERAGTRPIVLKGPSTARLLYPGEVRISQDVDLLIDPRREARARS